MLILLLQVLTFKDLVGTFMIGLYLNDWTIQQIGFLTPTLGSLCNIAKYLTHAVPACKRVKLMVKALFSVLFSKHLKLSRRLYNIPYLN